jgi:putative sterol carrier protein
MRASNQEEQKMDFAECTRRITEKVGADSGLGAKLKFDCGDAGRIFIDGTAVPNHVSHDDAPADCTIKIALADLVALLEGTLEPTTGFMTGRFTVDGDIGVALKLQRVI